MARSRKYSRKSQKRRRRGTKRRGQTGGEALGYSEVGGADMAGAAKFMEAQVGNGQAQANGPSGSIAINKAPQAGGARKRRKGSKKLRGGSLMDALSSAVVPLALFGMNHKIGRRLRKTR